MLDALFKFSATKNARFVGIKGDAFVYELAIKEKTEKIEQGGNANAHAGKGKAQVAGSGTGSGKFSLIGFAERVAMGLGDGGVCVRSERYVSV